MVSHFYVSPIVVHEITLKLIIAHTHSACHTFYKFYTFASQRSQCQTAVKIYKKASASRQAGESLFRYLILFSVPYSPCSAIYVS